MKKKGAKAKLDFGIAFKYPFNRARAMWNILWILLPIFGWFALWGYGIRIVQEFSKGKFKKLPVFKFGNDMKLGFFMFLKAIPFMLVYIAIIGILKAINPGLSGLIDFLLIIFAIPMLSINFMNKQTVSSFFEFKIIKSVFNNLGDYIITLLKSFLLAIVFILMMVILVGIPAMVFTQNIFLADFYRRNVK